MPNLKSTLARYLLRGRHEIIQHTKAYQHLIHALVTLKQDLTEDLIKETHKILTTGPPIIHEGSPDMTALEEYGGVYRTVGVGAGVTNFSVPKFVPEHMKMCDTLAQDLAAAQSANTIDPFSVAAKYSLEFVQIHPFQDGNSRMCRMILNVILCRFVGIIIPIGGQGEERSEYMVIRMRASQEMEGHGKFATFVLQAGITRLQEMKKLTPRKAHS